MSREMGLKKSTNTCLLELIDLLLAVALGLISLHSLQECILPGSDKKASISLWLATFLAGIQMRASPFIMTSSKPQLSPQSVIISTVQAMTFSGGKTSEALVALRWERNYASHRGATTKTMQRNETTLLVAWERHLRGRKACKMVGEAHLTLAGSS